MGKIEARCWFKGCVFEVDEEQFKTPVLAIGLIPARKRQIKYQKGKRTMEKYDSCPVCHCGVIYIPDCGALMPHVGVWAVREGVTHPTAKHREEHDFCFKNLNAWLKENETEIYSRRCNQSQNSHNNETNADAKLGAAVRGLVNKSQQKGDSN